MLRRSDKSEKRQTTPKGPYPRDRDPFCAVPDGNGYERRQPCDGRDSRRTAVRLAAAILLILAATGCGRSLLDRRANNGNQPTETNPVQNKREETIPTMDNSFSYNRSRLSGEDLALYDQICAMISAHEAQTELRCSDENRPFDVYHYVLADHPEFFWAEGSANGTWWQSGSVINFTLVPTYSLTAAESQRLQIQLDAVVAPLRGELGGRSDYDKVKGVYEYVIEHTRYEKTGGTDQSLCTVLLEGHGVCAAYAKSTQYLLHRLGVQALYVWGTADGGGHAWNVVKIDGNWYQLDTTWGDPTSKNGIQTLSWDYFCLTDAEMGLDHTPDPSQFYPSCSAVAANYYRREGRYFTSCDREGIRRLFEEDAARRQPVAFRVDSEVYDEILQWLIEEKGVFDILRELDVSGLVRNRFGHSENETLHTLRFTLYYE